MNKTRIEAFSDGVLAIIITIMVLEIKVPHEASLEALTELLPIFTSYLLSFVYIGIYWGNHHHLFHTVKKVNSTIIWANLGLLFTLSLVPFSTGWMGENHYAELPVALYSGNLLLCGFAAYLLQSSITSGLSKDDKIFEIIKKNMKKTVISVSMNIMSIVCAFFYPMVSLGLIIASAILWVIPDKSIERLAEGINLF
jgi:uncharacterized membrane protein